MDGMIIIITDVVIVKNEFRIMFLFESIFKRKKKGGFVPLFQQ